jgi:hypothetical protein
MRRRSASLALSLLWLLPLSGCCSFARFFCGPDRTPWISVDYSSPEKAARTLLEALRRDEPEVVYLSLSHDYRKRLGVDATTVQLAWPKIRDANPGLHVAGYAEVPMAERVADDRAVMKLDVEGYPIELQLVRQAKSQVRWRRPNGTLAEAVEPLTSFAGYLRSELHPDNDEMSRVTFAPLLLPLQRTPSDDYVAVPLEALESVGFEREWKIADLRLREPANR